MSPERSDEIEKWAPAPGRAARIRFRDRAQRARVCRALLETVDQARLWGSRGPRPRAHVAPPSEAGGDAQRMLSLCWAIWRDTDSLAFVELLSLDDARLRCVAGLLDALSAGPGAIDAWLEQSPGELAPGEHTNAREGG